MAGLIVPAVPQDNVSSLYGWLVVPRLLNRAVAGFADICLGREPVDIIPAPYDAYVAELRLFVDLAGTGKYVDKHAHVTRTWMFWYFGLGECPDADLLNKMTAGAFYAKYGARIYETGQSLDVMGSIVGKPGVVLTEEHRELLRLYKDHSRLRELASAPPSSEPLTAAVEEAIDRAFSYTDQYGLASVVPGPPTGALAEFKRPPGPPSQPYSLVSLFVHNRAMIHEQYPTLGHVGYSAYKRYFEKEYGRAARDIDLDDMQPDFAHLHRLAYAAVQARRRDAAPRAAPAQVDAPIATPEDEWNKAFETKCLTMKDDSDFARVVRALLSSPTGVVDVDQLRSMCTDWHNFRSWYINRRASWFVRVDVESKHVYKVGIAPGLVVSNAIRSRVLDSP